MISTEDFSIICRICLGKDNIIPFETKHLVALSEINLEVDLTNTLPQNICTSCATELENIDRFIEKFDQSQKLLESINKMTVEFKLDSPMTECLNCKRIFMRSGMKQHYRTNPQCMPQYSQGPLTNDHVDSSLNNDRVAGSLTSNDVAGSMTNGHLNGSLTNDHVGLTKKRPYKCEECPDEFTNAKNLRKHALKHHSKNGHDSKPAFTCELCQKGFTQKRSLHDHINLHTGETPYVCEYCGKRFARYATHKKHIYRFHIFEKKFKRKYSDKRVDQNYPCNICDRVFESRSGYKYHQRVHKKLKTFLCDICGKNFITKDILKGHLRTHTAEEPFECKTCGKRFRQRNSLKVHMREHIEDDSSTCPNCCKSFETNEEFEEHVANHELIRCPQCKKSFLKQNIEKHISSHGREKSYKCQLCEKSFTCPAHLNNHQRTHSGEKPFSCTVCEKSFSQPQALKIHMRRHTGERPYICEICNKGFCDSTHLKRHVNTHQKKYIEINEETLEIELEEICLI